MTEKINYWLIIYEDGSTQKDFAATLERVIEIQRTIYNKTGPIWAIIRIADPE